LIIEIYDSVRTPEERASGANLYAGSVVTMVAAHDAEVAPGSRELAGLHVFDPRPENTDRDLVFFLARHGAGMAADASILVDNKPVAHKNRYCTKRNRFNALRTGADWRCLRPTLRLWRCGHFS
jgi:hypothetical protein